MSTALERLPADADAAEVARAIDTDGGVIVDEVMHADARARLAAELEPYIREGRAGTNDFAGRSTVRIGALIARSAVSRELAIHPIVNGACRTVLAPYCDGYQLHFSQAVSIGPGEGAQALHRDRAVWGEHVPRSIETQLSTIWAVTDFSEENGATRIVPGSHRWEDDREPEPDEVVAAEMRAGSVLIYNGSVLHGGGANRSQANRLGVLLHYTLNWLRQEENQYLSCPPEIARDFSPELRSLLGYSQGGFVLGFYSPPDAPGSSPELVPPEHLFGEKPIGWARIRDEG